MSWSFWINVAIVLGSISGAFLDHGETFKAFRAARSGPTRYRKLAKLILLWGVPVLSLVALPFTAWDSFKSERVFREARVLANNAIAEASASNPRKQPIVSASARVRLVVLGTNITFIDPVKDNAFVNVQFGRSEQAKSNIWALMLRCSSFTKVPQGDKIWYFIEFHSDPLAPLWNVGSETPVERADEWDAVLLAATFVRADSQILDGDVFLTLNSSVSRRFAIAPQKAGYEDHTPPQMIGTKSNAAFVKVFGGW
jgi:hypothetical protein